VDLHPTARSGPVNRQECLRELYSLYGQPELAGRWIDGLIDDCPQSSAKEVRGVARTLKRWRRRSWPGTPRERPTVPPRA
jgi:hypothetical protein